MSRLRDLMDELCPSGVKYKKLGEICVILDSHRRPVTKKDRVTGQYPYYGANGIQDYVDDFIFDGTFLLIGEDGSVLTEQGTPVVHWAIGKIWVNNHAHILKEKGEILLRFLFHYMQTVKIHHLVKGVPPKLNQKDLREIPIPVPPLEIQNEIVKLLDNFTELTAELTAELTLRKKQYNFYRDSLLNFVRVDDTIVQTDRQTDRQVQRISKFGLLWKTFDVEWKTLGEVCGLKAGTAISASCIREQKNDVYKTPCYGGNGLRGYVQEVNHYSDAPLIGRQGALCGNVCFAKAPYYATEHAVIVDGKKNFNNRFLFHVLVNMNLGQYKTAGAQPGLSVKRLNKVKIAIPKLEIQNSIANILDSFEALCNDLTSGLPAEIAARKKQYEHYRDRLLTFKRKESTVIREER